MRKSLKLFITYSHKNTAEKDELITRLALLKHEGLISIWHDNEILPGDKWRNTIFSNLDDSDLLLYLTSAHSLDSENCNKELAAALNAEIRVVPIILENCDWQHHQLSDFQALPDRAKPIDKWPPRSDGWQNVVSGIRKTVADMQSQADPDSGISEKELRSKLLFQHGNTMMMLGQMDIAIEAYSNAINLNSRYAVAYYNRGNVYYQKGKFDNAISDYNTAINLNFCHAIVYYNRGILYSKIGKIGNAIKDYTMTVRLSPCYANAYYNRGLAYAERGDFDKAIGDYTKVIEFNSDDAIAYYNRANAYGAKDKVELAIKDYTKAIELKSNYADAYTNRGNAYYQKGVFDDAINDYNTAIKLNEFDVDAYNNRGNIYSMKGKIDDAINDYNAAIKLNSCYANAYNNRGNAYADKGKFELAIENYTKTIELNSEFPQPYYSRGVAWIRLKEWEKAKSDLMTAKKMDLDIVALFHNAYKGVEKFEKHFGFKLPEDIAHLLTERLRVRYPKTRSVLDADGNPLESPTVLNLLSQLRNAGMPLGEYVKTKPAFGINTTPTDVFVVDKAVRDELIASHAGSAEILKPFLQGEDIRRWHVDTPHRWLIFAHRGIAINDYPAILQYLEKHREPLSKRKGKQAWYELAASLADAERLAQPKLVCPNTYNHQTFAVDTVGYYYGKTAYLIPTSEKWLCGLLNSRTVEWFYSQVSKQLTIDWLRARSGYIQQIPIPQLTSTQKALIAKIVDYLIFLQQQPTVNSKDLKHARDRIMLRYFERIIDGLVYEIYLTEELHQSDKHFLQPLLNEKLPLIEDIKTDKMEMLRNIFELLYERTHLVMRNLYYLSSVKAVRIIEGKI